MLTFGSLFAGIGGFDLGFERAGMECAWQVEIDEYCRRVLAKHWPNVPKYKDVRNVGKHNLRTVDVICGGFPCQDVSLANSNRQGFDGERSSLWFEFSRIVCEIHPGWVVVENTPGLLSSNDGRDIRDIYWEFSKMGYNARQLFLPAVLFGMPHLRERVFIVAHAKSKRCGAPMFLFGEYPKSNSDFRFRASIKRDLHGCYRKFPAAGILRVGNGFPTELDKCRIKALGNAVIPQIAEWIGRRIMAVESEVHQ
jgi:DNA (cytosine-5)-methyltransferase 1